MSPRNSHDAAAAAGLLKEPRDSLDALDSLDDVKPEPMDIESEAGRPHDANGNGKNLDHEYSVPSTVKFAWLGTYFFFSLALTLYNKAVLGMVSLDSRVDVCEPLRRGDAGLPDARRQDKAAAT